VRSELYYFRNSAIASNQDSSTKIKDQLCLDCDFATADPSSLTRHRKRCHKYVPKPRKPRTPGSGSTGAQPDIIIETPATYSQKLEPISLLRSLPMSTSRYGSDVNSEMIIQTPAGFSHKLEPISPLYSLSMDMNGDIHRLCSTSTSVYMGIVSSPSPDSPSEDSYLIPRRARRLGLFDILSPLGDGPQAVMY
jgi:hypothetical protein